MFYLIFLGFLFAISQLLFNWKIISIFNESNWVWSFILFLFGATQSRLRLDGFCSKTVGAGSYFLFTEWKCVLIGLTSANQISEDLAAAGDSSGHVDSHLPAGSSRLRTKAYIKFYFVLLGFTGFYWVLLGFIRIYWVLLGFTEFLAVG